MVLVVVASCERRNPDVCCETEAECAHLGFETPQPCALGVCVGNVCASDGCDGDEDCTAPQGFCVQGACVACRDDAGCSSDTPVCDQGDHSCRRCGEDTECSTGVCDVPTGTCAEEDTIRFASPGGGTADPCTRARPCSLAQALSVADVEHPYIEMTPGTYTVGGTLRGNAATVVGADATLSVLDASAELSVAGQGALAVRHLKVNVGSASLEGLSCVEMSSLVLSDVAIAGARISGDSCQNLTITSSTFTDSGVSFGDGGIANAGVIVDKCRFIRGGLGIGGGGFFARVTNSLFTAPQNNPVLLSLLSVINTLPTTDTIIAFNTFVGGTINCNDPAMPSRTRSFANNIFVDLDAPLPKSNACRYDYNDVLPPDFTLGGFGNINADPKFVDGAAGDYHLQLGSPALDAADPTATNDHDLDGNPRPQNGRADMGAFERAP
jgi:hypothetical protein